jgi:hypothetical protein
MSPNAITSSSSALLKLKLILELGDLMFQGCSGGFNLRGGESGRRRRFRVRLSATLGAHALVTEFSLDYGVYVETVHVPCVGDEMALFLPMLLKVHDTMLTEIFFDGIYVETMCTSHVAMMEWY